MNTIEDYIKMQKDYYENLSLDPERQIVGNYAWHEQLPYEQLLLNYDGIESLPLFNKTEDKVALDFGCGPGRMVNRMYKLFKQVDGADISQRLVDICKSKFPNANFYVTDGKSLGNASSDYYDFIYSTICMQHIASYDVRMAIFEDILRCLKPGGYFTVQMAYHIDRYFNQHAKWHENRLNASSTNSGCDVIINRKDLLDIENDFITRLDANPSFWFYQVSDKYANLNGQMHPIDYWPSHYIFINCKKR